ncbi:MAG: sugar kinase, partial [Gemmataceae bacterium]|nr:sugar kinase [Gemmataceae bacterium]
LDGKKYVSPTCQLDVIDRIGGGDGFASGCIYGLLAGRTPDEALRLGWAHGALLTTYHGDVTMARLDEVEAFARGGSARVQR